MLNIKAILPYYISLIVLLVFTYLSVKYWHSIQKQPKYFTFGLSGSFIKVFDLFSNGSKSLIKQSFIILFSLYFFIN